MTRLRVGFRVLNLRRFLCVLLPPLLSSCGSPEGGDSGGDRALSIQVHDEFQVGSMDAEEWQTFSRIAGVAFDGVGNLYLLDADNFRVVKVAPDGSLLAEMGGEGDGPGEFGMPMAFSVTRSGEVRVFDMGYGGFVVFNSDGSYKTSVPMDPEAMLFPSGALPSHPNGGVLAANPAMGMRIGPNGPEFPDTRPLHLLTLAEEVEVGAVYEGWNPATADGPPSLSVTEGGGVSLQAPPIRAFDPDLLSGVFNDGRIAVTDSTTYEVKILDPNGGVQQVVQRDFAPREVTQDDRDAEKERRLEELAASGGPRITMRTNDGNTTRLGSEQVRSMVENRLEGMVFAAEMPLIADLAVDWEDRIWVKRFGSAVGEEGPLDILDLDGGYLGTVAPGEGRIPDAFGPDGLAAYIETDELDVPSVVVRRLSIG
jgi:hypothetical protein